MYKNLELCIEPSSYYTFTLAFTCDDAWFLLQIRASRFFSPLPPVCFFSLRLYSLYIYIYTRSQDVTFGKERCTVRNTVRNVLLISRKLTHVDTGKFEKRSRSFKKSPRSFKISKSWEESW